MIFIKGTGNTDETRYNFNYDVRGIHYNLSKDEEAAR